jgi:hypothetical protein
MAQALWLRQVAHDQLGADLPQEGGIARGSHQDPHALAPASQLFRNMTAQEAGRSRHHVQPI